MLIPLNQFLFVNCLILLNKFDYFTRDKCKLLSLHKVRNSQSNNVNTFIEDEEIFLINSLLVQQEIYPELCYCHLNGLQLRTVALDLLLKEYFQTLAYYGKYF